MRKGAAHTERAGGRTGGGDVRGAHLCRRTWLWDGWPHHAIAEGHKLDELIRFQLKIGSNGAVSAQLQLGQGLQHFVQGAVQDCDALRGVMR